MTSKAAGNMGARHWVGSGYVRLGQAYCWQHSLTRNWIGRRITVRAGRNDFACIAILLRKGPRDVYRTSDLSCKGWSITILEWVHNQHGGYRRYENVH